MESAFQLGEWTVMPSRHLFRRPAGRPTTDPMTDHTDNQAMAPHGATCRVGATGRVANGGANLAADLADGSLSPDNPGTGKTSTHTTGPHNISNDNTYTHTTDPHTTDPQTCGKDATLWEDRTVQPQTIRLLDVLAADPGHTFTRTELIDQVWAGMAVSDAAVDRAVCNLRKALGDCARTPRYIQTVRKRGVRLMVPVEPVLCGSGVDRISPLRPARPVPASPTPGREGSGRPQHRPDAIEVDEGAPSNGGADSRRKTELIPSQAPYPHREQGGGQGADRKGIPDGEGADPASSPNPASSPRPASGPGPIRRFHSPLPDPLGAPRAVHHQAVRRQMTGWAMTAVIVLLCLALGPYLAGMGIDRHSATTVTAPPPDAVVTSGLRTPAAPARSIASSAAAADRSGQRRAAIYGSFLRAVEPLRAAGYREEGYRHAVARTTIGAKAQIEAEPALCMPLSLGPLFLAPLSPGLQMPPIDRSLA